jgi:hypothetical protein
MPKASLGVLGVVAVAGWATAFLYFTESGGLAGKLETSEVELGEITEDFELAQREAKKSIEAAGRLDQIGEEFSALKDKVAAYERLIQTKQDELVTVLDELATLESELRQRKKQIPRTEADEPKQEAEPTQSEPPTEHDPEPQATPEAETSAAEPEPQAMPEAEASAAEPEPQTLPEAEASAAEASATNPESQAILEAEAIVADLEPQAMPEAEVSALEPETQAIPEVKASAADLVGPERVAEAERRFQIIDQDGDGKIDEFEFRLNSIKLLGLIDANDDGFITIEETLLSPEQFKLFDSDGDGKISSVEFTRAFPTIDTKQQGVITFEEYLAQIQLTAN